MATRTETPGQQARRLIREGEAVLADPTKAQYHDQMRAAIARMQAQLDWWAAVRDAMAEVDQELA